MDFFSTHLMQTPNNYNIFTYLCKRKTTKKLKQMKKAIIACLLAMVFSHVVQAQTSYTVAQDGSGDFSTIQAAINAAPEGEQTTIHIKAGIYEEQVCIGSKQKASTQKLSLIGEGMDKTVISSGIGMSSHNTTFDKTPAVSIYASDFYAEGITFRNTAGRSGGQALAIYVAGDRQTFFQCRFSGYQDTHRSKKDTRSYYKNCDIEGATDFIYAGGTAWFERCTINCVGGGYITAPEDITAYAQGENKRIFLGFIFNECKVVRTEGVSAGSIYLGRCWGPSKCGSLFLKCNLGDCIHPAGWQEMGGNNGKASYYGEYQSIGINDQPIDVSKRISWSQQMSDTDYEKVKTWALVDEAFRATTGSNISYDPESIIANHQQNEETHIDNDYAEPERKLLAFPSARGFGKFARGGRGGKVIEVTNLNDDGEGSLRWALQQGNQNATIVFRVSGIIRLQSDIRAKLKNVTIAGQTAPGMGIMYYGAKLNLGGSSNLIMRNIRGRIGMSGEDFRDGGSIGIENADTLIIDHCCFGWSAEENMTIYDNHFTTVQWTIVHEGLYEANHRKGVRGYGAQWGGSPGTYHHNLLAHNVSRSPRINGASNIDQDRNVFLEYYNNVNYNWGSTGACYGGENEAGVQSSHECNFIGNYYKPGPATPKSGNLFISISKNRSGKTSSGPSRWYFMGNKMEGNDAATNDNWQAVKNNTGYDLQQLRSDTLITSQEKYYWPRANKYDYADYQTPTESADQAYSHVIAHVGTINRDFVEQRVVKEVAEKTATYQGDSKKGKGIIDQPSDAEGFLPYPQAEAPKDDDHDGMADDWEAAHGLDPTNPEDRNLIATVEGYTALEVYLNSLMGEHIAMNLAGIHHLESQKTTSEEQFFNMQGMRRQHLHQGLNIVRHHMTDGTTRTAKLFVSHTSTGVQ